MDLFPAAVRTSPETPVMALGSGITWLEAMGQRSLRIENRAEAQNTAWIGYFLGLIIKSRMKAAIFYPIAL